MKKNKEEIVTKHYKFVNLSYKKLIIFLCMVFALSISLIFSTFFESFINYKGYIVAKDGTNIYENGMFVHFIDVGHGDSTLIELPDGKSVLIDCGNYGDDFLIDYLSNCKNLSDNTIDYMILTHDHDDHYGKMADILDGFEVKNIIRPNVFATEIESANEENLYYGINNSDSFKKVVCAIKKEVQSGANSIIAYEGLKIEDESSNYCLKCLSPNYDKYNESNDYSPIMTLSYYDKKIIFSGDAEENVERYAVTNYFNELDSDVMKVGHHGSNTSSCQSYLDAVSAEYAVISTKENAYENLPSKIILDRLASSGINHIFRTDLDSTIICSFDKENNIFLGSIEDFKTPNNTVYVHYYYIAIIMFVIIDLILFNKKVVVIKL